MRALTLIPGKAGSLAVTDVPDPAPAAGDLLVDGLAMGVCGTDRDIASGTRGWTPPGAERMVLGHESLGRVRTAPPGSGFAAGDLVVGIVRRPDPVPCGACARGEFDMCRNGLYTERGIKQLDGFGSQVWTVEADYAVRLDPALETVGVLMEPTTIMAKCWDQIDRINQRAWFAPQRVLITGAGPIGLLAALLGVQRGLEVHVLDQVGGGPKPGIVTDLGATYHVGDLSAVAKKIEPEIVIEATGSAQVALESLEVSRPAGTVCLVGVSSAAYPLPTNAGPVSRKIVLDNTVIFGSVNANRRHYEQAAEALAQADKAWLERLITRRIPLEQALTAFEAGDGTDIKAVIDLASAGLR